MIKDIEPEKTIRLSPTKKLLLLLMGLLLLGVLAGALSLSKMNAEQLSDMTFLTQGFIKNRYEQTFIQTFLSSFMTAGGIVMLCLVLGFSAIAQPAQIAVLIFRGIGLGSSIAYLYISYGLRGFFIALIMVIPNAVISSFAIILAVREGLRLSNVFAHYAFSQKEIDKRPDLKLYLLKFIILFAIIAVSSLLDSILAYLFAGVLNF